MNCYWCETDCGGLCLGLRNSQQMKTDDPTYWMLRNDNVTIPTVHSPDCYICTDPEYAQMGMSLCLPCEWCTKNAGRDAGHIPADDDTCSVRGEVVTL